MTKKSFFAGVGYIMNDNRASGGVLTEDDVLGCKHCQACIDKRNWKAFGENRCFKCDEPVCSICNLKMRATGECTNFEKVVERAVEDRVRAEQNAKILGI